MLIKKIKKNFNERTGTQYGPTIGLIMSSGRGLVGYSVANVKKGDFFNRDLAEDVCMSRMASDTPEVFFSKYCNYFNQKNTCMAERIYNELLDMKDRSLRYYKGE